MAEKRIDVAQDPAAVRAVLATVPFAGLEGLIAALRWLKDAPHLEKDSGTERHPVSLQVDQAGSHGVVELRSFSRAASIENFYGEEVNVSYVIGIRGAEGG